MTTSDAFELIHEQWFRKYGLLEPTAGWCEHRNNDVIYCVVYTDIQVKCVEIYVIQKTHLGYYDVQPVSSRHTYPTEFRAWNIM